MSHAVFPGDGTVLTDTQRQALAALADCFAEDGILIDAQNIRAALACIQDAAFRASAAEADALRVRSQLDEARQRVATFETAGVAGGWKQRAQIAEAEAERLKRERNEARSTAQGILASLKQQGEAADAAEASAAALTSRVQDLERALREAVSAMRSCVALTAPFRPSPFPDIGAGGDPPPQEEATAAEDAGAEAP
ncbi:hypothetical protein [Methylobacterium sp. J-076]|uniref:hypothetical protein n=1 Tax=Methylobacterium sp. J-076 TaxID=2836655 RepID=UPI001FBBFA97|nr:hypothetical protein [Methylobacterium sp. J-076]MCJ2013719.1 hypothetical protein [Methylobacterium sp. J-076]